MPMNAGTAYLLLVAFAGLCVFGIADPLIDQVGDSINTSAAQLQQLTKR